eukprot:TRINITY_DN7326_c0_g1_i1.p1 TRINITY_DN7326_c0_g1~~TRINITY_DN7326_c0_g1_i1.p1  ORF type:complete len:823 (+),score=193.79 TRINITY_DN7326_c0_g1_i1:210-2471(+)
MAEVNCTMMPNTVGTPAHTPLEVIAKSGLQPLRLGPLLKAEASPNLNPNGLRCQSSNDTDTVDDTMIDPDTVDNGKQCKSDSRLSPNPRAGRRRLPQPPSQPSFVSTRKDVASSPPKPSSAIDQSLITPNITVMEIPSTPSPTLRPPQSSACPAPLDETLQGINEPVGCASLLDPIAEEEHCALMEIVHTERHYHKELTTIVEQFLCPLEADSGAKQFLDQAEVEAIFVNVQVLLEWSWRMLQGFEVFAESLQATNSPHSNDNIVFVSAAHSEQTIPGVLLDHLTYFKEHERFCKHQAASPIDLTQMRASNPALHAWLTKREMDSKALRGMRLQDLLLTPMQRLTRYPLLLTVLIKHTPESSSRQLHLREAHRVISQYLQHANEEARLMVSDKRAQSVLERLKDRRQAAVWLQQEHITLVAETTLRLTANRMRKVRAEAYLFSEVLLLCRATRPISVLASSMARSTLNRRSTSEAASRDGKLKAIAVLPLKRLLVVPSKMSTREIEVYDMDHQASYILEYEVPGAVQQWLDHFKQHVPHNGRWRRRRGAVQLDDQVGLAVLQAAQMQHNAGPVEPDGRSRAASISSYASLSLGARHDPLRTPRPSDSHYLNQTPMHVRQVRGGRRNMISTPQVSTPFRQRSRLPAAVAQAGPRPRRGAVSLQRHTLQPDALSRWQQVERQASGIQEVQVDATLLEVTELEIERDGSEGGSHARAVRPGAVLQRTRAHTVASSDGSYHTCHRTSYHNSGKSTLV